MNSSWWWFIVSSDEARNTTKVKKKTDDTNKIKYIINKPTGHLGWKGNKLLVQIQIFNEKVKNIRNLWKSRNYIFANKL